MSTRSDHFQAQYVDASQKFDYYVTGFTGALAAYIGKSLTPVRIGLSVESLEFFAFLALMLSVVIGFRRIETLVVLLREQAQTIKASEDSALATEVSMQPQSRLLVGGLALGSEHARRYAKALSEQVEQIDAGLKSLSEEAGRQYSWRNRTLLFGALLLVLARILPAYA